MKQLVIGSIALVLVTLGWGAGIVPAVETVPAPQGESYASWISTP
jgi:hypothetical protein